MPSRIGSSIPVSACKAVIDEGLEIHILFSMLERNLCWMGRAGGSNLGIFGDGKVSRGDWFSAGKGRVGRDLSGYRRSRGPLLNNLSS